MSEKGERGDGMAGFKLVCVKILLGAAAAAVGIVLLRMTGGGELRVAILIGLVPGAAERSGKKIMAGAVLALAGYLIGAQVGHTVAKSFEGVPLGHWAVTGAFIGLTSGMSRKKDRWLSPRPRASVIGAVCGLILGALFGVLGDLGGLMAAFTSSELVFYQLYIRETSLILAGIFINFGSALASGLTGRLERKAENTTEIAEG